MGTSPSFEKLSENPTFLNGIQKFSKLRFMAKDISFLCAVVEYKRTCMSVPDSDEQFARYLNIINCFIVNGSPNQIKISNELRKDVAIYMHSYENYCQLLSDPFKRMDVFGDIFQVIESNFWINYEAEPPNYS